MSQLKEGGPIEHGNIPMSPAQYLARLEAKNNGHLDAKSLPDFLAATLPTEKQPNRNTVSDILDAIAVPERLAGIIDSILTDPDQMEEIAARSFGHSIGMDRMEIAKYGDYTLRLHFWIPGKGEPIVEDPHNHTYNFGSKIISGLLVTDLFTAEEDGAHLNSFKISSQNSEEKPKPEFAGEAALQPASPREGVLLSSEDSAYTMNSKTIHRIRQEDTASPVITLNLRGGAVKDRSTFFRSESMPVANPAPTALDIDNRLGALRHILQRKI